MNRILTIQHSARCAYKATGGRLDRIDLSGYSKCSRLAFIREWRKCRFPFLKTVNDLRYEKKQNKEISEV